MLDRIDGQEITEYLLNDRQLLLKTIDKMFFLVIAVDVDNHDTISVKCEDGHVYERLMPLKWEGMVEQVIAHTIPEHRARVMSFIDPSVQERLTGDAPLTFSYRSNAFTNNGSYRWVDVIVSREYINDKTFILYKCRDVTDSVNERHALLELTSRDDETYLLNRFYLSEMIRNEYTKLESAQVILMDFQEIGVENVEQSGTAIRCAAEAALSLTRYNCHLYRYTPKEMLVVIKNGSKEDIADFLHDWQIRMDFMMKDIDVEYILVTGVASARVPFSVYDLISQCEKEVIEKKHQHQLTDEAKSAAEKRRLRNRLDRIVKYLDGEYLSLYEIDLESDRYYTIVENTDPRFGNLPKEGAYEQTFNDAADMYISERSREERKKVGSIENLRKALKNERRVEFEYETVDRSSWRRALWQVVEKDGDMPTRAVLAHVGIDNSEAERMRQQNDIIEAFRKQEEKGEVSQEFISRMSHDIRTPLNAIIGMTMLAKNAGNDHQKLENCLRRIDEASGQLLSLVNEILDISRMQNGRTEVVKELFNIESLFEGIKVVAEPLAAEHDHHFRIEIEGMEHEVVYGDLHRMQRICNNIISNSIKYTPDGGHIILRVSETIIDDSHGLYRFEFIDDGIGMSPEFINKIFDPFTRAEDHRVEKRTGTGLGMAITRNLVNMLGGEITVSSELNVGTTIVVEMPMKHDEDAYKNAPDSVREAGVLVVYDKEQADPAGYTVSGKPIESVLNRFTVPADVAYMDESAVTKVKEKHATDKPYMMVFVCPMAYNEKVADTIQKIRMEAGGLTPIALILPGEWMSFEIDARARGVNFFASRPVFSKTIYDFVNKAYLLRTKDGEEDEDDDVLPDCAGGRIMVVEDNDINAEIILEILGTTGVLTDRMTNGLEAVNKFKDVPENWYDLILMDVEMPVMDGYEATRAIRSCIRPDAKTIPIVAMTANAFSSDMEKAISAGMNDHLPKPIEIVKLGKILREYCLYRKEGE